MCKQVYTGYSSPGTAVESSQVSMGQGARAGCLQHAGKTARGSLRVKNYLHFPPQFWWL